MEIHFQGLCKNLNAKSNLYLQFHVFYAIKEPLMNRILTIACLLFILSCKKEEAVKPVPVIIINTPTNNQHFVIGDTIRISGTITHNIELTEAAVHMTDISTKDEFYHSHLNPFNQLSLSHEFKYKIPNNTKSTFQVEIEATDKNGNTANKEVMITIN